MPVDPRAARDFVHANARLLDRLRFQCLVGGPADPVVDALRAYQDPDGGFGHALEPDVRGPHSEPTAALHGLEVLAEVDALDLPLVAQVLAWVDRVALDDGGVPFVVEQTAEHPHAPWMQPVDGGSHLTYGLAAVAIGRDLPWVERGVAWSWRRIEDEQPLDAYALKFALAFLDAVPAEHSDHERAERAVERQRSLIRADGTVPVPGGTDDEQLTALDLSPTPGARSRVLFTGEQVEASLDLLESGQQGDGGWTFDWLAWSPGQSAEWRGLVTLRAVRTLVAHGRLERTALR